MKARKVRYAGCRPRRISYSFRRTWHPRFPPAPAILKLYPGNVASDKTLNYEYRLIHAAPYRRVYSIRRRLTDGESRRREDSSRIGNEEWTPDGETDNEPRSWITARPRFVRGVTVNQKQFPLPVPSGPGCFAIARDLFVLQLRFGWDKFFFFFSSSRSLDVWGFRVLFWERAVSLFLII